MKGPVCSIGLSISGARCLWGEGSRAWKGGGTHVPLRVSPEEPLRGRKDSYAGSPVLRPDTFLGGSVTPAGSDSLTLGPPSSLWPLHSQALACFFGSGVEPEVSTPCPLPPVAGSGSQLRKDDPQLGTICAVPAFLVSLEHTTSLSKMSCIA